MAAFIGTIIIDCALLAAGGLVLLSVVGALCATLGGLNDDGQ